MTDSLAPLEHFVQEKMGETGLPGLSLALVRKGEVVWSRGFGFRDLERGLPVTPQTLFGVGSVTKSLTCLALLQLQERGLLDLEDPVDRYLPLPVRPPGEEPIRLRHLMAHTSGLPALGYAEATIRHHVGTSQRWFPISGIEDMLAFLDQAQPWLVASPGERWFYLNEGYVLLGAVIERVSGQPYPDYVRQHILQPLGMTRSGFRPDDVQGDPDAAIPYVIDREKRRTRSAYLFGGIQADGGLISCAADLARYVAMFLAGGRGPGVALLPPDMLCGMWQPRVPIPFWRRGLLGPEPAVFYGYGLQVTPDFLGETLVGHGGSVLVFTAYVGFVPQRGVGVALLANGSGYPLNQMGAFALALLLGADPWSVPALRAERLLDGLTGVYETYRGTMRATVVRRGDYLVLEMQDGPQEQAALLVPQGYDAAGLDPQRPRFVTLAAARWLPVEFTRREGEVDLIYERYRLRRVGRL
ncbi:MAG: serine hydrolase [Armatimonadota bacterium]|nr:serine hydrolase [Armatimonadota bacterium]